jgi:hypothetical protein
MSAPLAANECRRQVRYDYTKDERIQKAITLGESLDRYAATEAELSRIKKDYTARLDGIQAEVDGLNLAVRTGYELREYICYWTYDEPKQGRKTLRKREGGEIVAEEDMTERDRQMVMEIIDAQAAVGAAAQPGEKLALPAYTMPASVEDVVLSEDQMMSFDIDAGLCMAFSDVLFAVFVIDSESGDALRDEPSREAQLATLFAKRDTTWLTGFAVWLRENPRAAIPGTAWLADAVEAHLRGEKIKADAAKAKEAAAKKDARTGRRAGASGTVEVDADEGSRDDYGPESKNDL